MSDLPEGTAPGFYLDEANVPRWWSGKDWTDHTRTELPPPGTYSDKALAALKGWYRISASHFRWWTGSGWGRARWAVDGTVSVAESVGQAVIVMPVDRGDQPNNYVEIITLLEGLRENWPPVRIVQLHRDVTDIVTPTTGYAIVEWSGPPA